MFELFELIYWLIAVRYMWIGLIGGSLLAGLYEQFGGSASSDVYIGMALLGAAIGFVLDVRRGLRRRTEEDDSIGADWRRKK